MKDKRGRVNRGLYRNRGRAEHWDQWDEGMGMEERGRTYEVQGINIKQHRIPGVIFLLSITTGLWLRGCSSRGVQ